MNTIFDEGTRAQLIGRIKTLNQASTPLWGKMNVYQMLKHCTLSDEMYQGNKQYKRVFIGRILGKMALKSLTKDDAPMGKNAPTGNDFKVQQTVGDIAAEKDKLITLINGYANYSNDSFVHWFFGPMTKEQVGYLAYKHLDHHLRQFNS
ncbi:DUF1569 domain-containing protein [Mucilaginibacter sp. HMF5004]|uniref:DUF1569 domain-containing protein n=1 Tax=Mucilaginibacter rivuli TaxID=2857527 RepID=UPI001C5D8200|nr:DUF1569 domain-containing protein [Mucilaginibacter rivuli]MBW4888627.1 DUF1569 domain-containing protein [Mucilaginibacter rivuli]